MRESRRAYAMSCQSSVAGLVERRATRANEIMPSPRVVLKFAAAYAVLAALFALVVGSFNWSKFRRLAEYGVTTEGRVVETRCEQHNTAKFRFSVAGKIFEGIDNIPNCDATRPGDLLRVMYLPAA